MQEAFSVGYTTLTLSGNAGRGMRDDRERVAMSMPNAWYVIKSIVFIRALLAGTQANSASDYIRLNSRLKQQAFRHSRLPEAPQ